MYKNENIVKACNILFGPDFKFYHESLDYLQLSGIKNAYREKSKIFHPDRAYIVGEDESVLAENFKELNKAYNTLLSYKKSSNFKNILEIKKNHNKTTGDRKNFYYKGIMPKRELRFGEFLYYIGKISWNDLIDSIVKQYTFRGKIGRICIELDYLEKDDIASILNNQKIDEKFGECAVRLGYLDTRQLKKALHIQNVKKYPIGRYFLESNLISKEELPVLLHENRKYNIKIKIMAD